MSFFHIESEIAQKLLKRFAKKLYMIDSPRSDWQVVRGLGNIHDRQRFFKNFMVTKAIHLPTEDPIYAHPGQHQIEIERKMFPDSDVELFATIISLSDMRNLGVFHSVIEDPTSPEISLANFMDSIDDLMKSNAGSVAKENEENEEKCDVCKRMKDVGEACWFCGGGKETVKPSGLDLSRTVYSSKKSKKL